MYFPSIRNYLDLYILLLGQICQYHGIPFHDPHTQSWQFESALSESQQGLSKQEISPQCGFSVSEMQVVTDFCFVPT